MNKGEEGERKKAEKHLKKVSLPTGDPIFGDTGPLKELWHKDETAEGTLTKESQF